MLCIRAQGFRQEDGAWSQIQSRGFEKGYYSLCVIPERKTFNILLVYLLNNLSGAESKESSKAACFVKYADNEKISMWAENPK